LRTQKLFIDLPAKRFRVGITKPMRNRVPSFIASIEVRPSSVVPRFADVSTVLTVPLAKNYPIGPFDSVSSPVRYLAR